MTVFTAGPLAAGSMPLSSVTSLSSFPWLLKSQAHYLPAAGLQKFAEALQQIEPTGEGPIKWLILPEGIGWLGSMAWSSQQPIMECEAYGTLLKLLAALDPRRHQAILLTGSPGVGKSTLGKGPFIKWIAQQRGICVYATKKDRLLLDFTDKKPQVAEGGPTDFESRWSCLSLQSAATRHNMSLQNAPDHGSKGPTAVELQALQSMVWMPVCASETAAFVSSLLNASMQLLAVTGISCQSQPGRRGTLHLPDVECLWFHG